MMSRGEGRALVFCTGLAAIVSGCALDDREIQRLGQNLSEAGAPLPPDDGGTTPVADGGVKDPQKPPPTSSNNHPKKTDAAAPAPASSHQTADGGRTHGGPPSAGAIFDGGADAGGCPDDNGDGNPDCQESLVVNWSLDRDASRFTAEGGATLAWRTDDANGKRGSGSLTVTDTSHDDSGGWAFTGATQCVSIQGDTTYSLRVQAFIPAGQKLGGANIGAQFFDDQACSGTRLVAYDAPPTDKAGTWTVVSGSTVAPSRARSALVRLVVLKPLADPPFTAWFDDVQVLVAPPSQ